MLLEFCSIPFVLLLTLVANLFDPPAPREVDGFDEWNTQENAELNAEFYTVPPLASFPDVEFRDMREQS